MDNEKTNYPDHLEDIEPDDYILDDTLSSWNREKKPIWKRLVTGSEAPFILMGIGLLVIITLFFLFAPKGDSGDSREQMIQLLGRIQQLEQKVADFDAIQNKLPDIEKQIESIQKKSKRLESMDASASLRIDRVVKDIKIVKEQFKSFKASSSLPPKSATTKPQKKISTTTPVESRKQTTKVVKKSAPKQVDAVYHQVKKGETLYRISLKHKISVETVKKLNGLKEGAAIYPGQKLLIKPPIVE